MASDFACNITTNFRCVFKQGPSGTSEDYRNRIVCIGCHFCRPDNSIKIQKVLSYTLLRLRNDLYCVEWDVKLYQYIIPYHIRFDIHNTKVYTSRGLINVKIWLCLVSTFELMSIFFSVLQDSRSHLQVLGVILSGTSH